MRLESLIGLEGMQQSDLIRLVAGSRKQKKAVWRKVHHMLKRRGYFKNHCERCFMRRHGEYFNA